MESNTIDPVTLEVIWNRFLSVANEQQDALIRTAFSTIVRESQDLACGLFDTKGRMIAQSLSGTPGHINAMATSMKHFLAAFPPEKLSPGDVLITNDPWQTAGNETGGRALLEMMEEFGLDSIDAVAEEIIRRSEAAVRAEIRRLPDG